MVIIILICAMVLVSLAAYGQLESESNVRSYSVSLRPSHKSAEIVKVEAEADSENAKRGTEVVEDEKISDKNTACEYIMISPIGLIQEKLLEQQMRIDDG